MIDAMPELAEVEYYRKRWDAGLRQRVTGVALHAGKRVFREARTVAHLRGLAGHTLLESMASGKQMLFRFSGGLWMGVHLGMTGTLRSEAPGVKPGPHDHLVLRQRDQSLVFRDPRQFGRIRLEKANQPPEWWRRLAPSVLSPEFTARQVGDFLRSKSRAPVKSVLLMQEGFPGIGNWMADEILWRSGIFPKRRCRDLEKEEIRLLWRQVRAISRAALSIIGRDFSDPPATWLLAHRWGAGGKCPRHGVRLEREPIGGRATCWCPVCQSA